MALTQRERKIGITVGAVLGAYLLYAYPVSGYINKRADLKEKIAGRNADLDEAESLAARRLTAETETLPFLVAEGLRDRTESESQLNHMLSEWSRDVGLNISAARSDQSAAGVGAAASAAIKAGFHEVKVTATAKGSQSGLVRLLWCLEVTKVPVRVNELTITVPKEGQDILSVQMGISTLALPPGNTLTGKAP